MNKYYMVVDLKSFYASVECVERNLNSLTTPLVVADVSRTETTICLAVSIALKKQGVKNRCRLFEIPKNLKYIIAKPQMAKYISYSADIYSLYLEYFSSDDIYAYSIDECFIDVTSYLKIYNKTPRQLGKFIIDMIFKRFKIQASCGIGTNMYLAKIALDIIAKNDAEYIGELNQQSFIDKLSLHQPLSDFWRIGKGIQKRLNQHNIFTMKDLREIDEMVIYQEFGVDGELLIDHAYGIEPVTIQDIKKYKPKAKSFTNSQVLPKDYSHFDGELILKEMLHELALRLTKSQLETNSISLYCGYSRSDGGSIIGGTISIAKQTASSSALIQAILPFYSKHFDKNKKIRRISIACNLVEKNNFYLQSLFEDNKQDDIRDNDLQKALNKIKMKYGKNKILKVADLSDNAMTINRNKQMGGHFSGE